MGESSCRFCSIIKGELPASFVFRGPAIVAFMDAFPLANGHVLVVPRSHYTDLFEIPEDLAVETFRLARKMAFAVKSALTDVTGVNLLQNNGASAGQKIYHFHIHVIPRTGATGVGGRLATIRQPADRAALDEIAEKLKTRLSNFDGPVPQ